MKVSYDQRTDSLTVVFKDHAQVTVSDMKGHLAVA